MQPRDLELETMPGRCTIFKHAFVLLGTALALALSTPTQSEAGVSVAAPALTPTLTPTPTAIPSVEPEYAILQYVKDAHPAWYCQGPLGTPGHRYLQNCYTFQFGTHPARAFVDYYGSAGAAETEWQSRRAYAQSSYPIFFDLSYGGYPGYQAGNQNWPYGHLENYFWGSVWVMGASSQDDTHYNRGSPPVALAVHKAAVALGFLGTPSPTPISTPPTITPTVTPTLTPSATWTPQYPCGVTFLSASTTCTTPTAFNYEFVFGPIHCSGTQDTATLYLFAAPTSGGPWTPQGAQTSTVYLSGGIVTVSGTFTGAGIPQSSRWYYISGTLRGASGASTPEPICGLTECLYNFTDVQPADYFYEAVRYLYCAGVISGYSDNTFRPYNNTTRGQLTKIVVLAFGLPLYTPPLPTFTDVPTTHTFYQYIETAAYEGLVSGYADGTFRPQNDVTRGQLSKIVVEAAGWPLLNPPTPTFSDVRPGNPFYQYVETAYDQGIISGYADGTFRPGNNATRGQISKIVYEAVIAP